MCNRVEVSEIPSGFAFSTKAKEIIDLEKVLRVLETDFAETSDKKKPYSVEDERFLRILESGVKKQSDGRYEMPFPLKSDNACLPNNRHLAAATFILKNFYVDDGLKSMPTVSEAIHLIKASQGICKRACLRLHKIVSNKKEVLEAFPAEDHAKGIKELNLAVDPLPIERALDGTN